MSQLYFSKALDIRPGITSVIGSGGKTTLLRTLAAELSDTAPVLLTTTTHFLPFPEYPLIDTASIQEDNVFGAEAEAAHLSRVLRESEALLAEGHRVIVLGSRLSPDPNKKQLSGVRKPSLHEPMTKLSSPALSDFRPLLRLFPYILVEADGSRRLPLKAHAGHEPVIPLGSQKSILLVGASGIGQPLDAVCHRPELYREILSILSVSRSFPIPAAQAENDSASHLLPDAAVQAEGYASSRPILNSAAETDPVILGQVLNYEALADCIFLNQLDPIAEAFPGSACIQDTIEQKSWHFTKKQLRIARELQETSQVPVFFGSLQKHCCCR